MTFFFPPGRVAMLLRWLLALLLLAGLALITLAYLQPGFLVDFVNLRYC